MTKRPVIFRAPFACLLIAAGLLLGAARGAAEPLGPVEPAVGGWIGQPMDIDPAIEPIGATLALDPRSLALWLDALEGEHVADRRRAARAIRAAHAEGVAGLAPALPVLMRVVNDDADPVARAEAAATLEALDDPAAAEALLAVLLEDDPDLVLPADRALRRWRHAPAAEAWLARLADADQPLALRLAAAQGLGRLGHTPSIEPLTGIVGDRRRPVSLRLAAAEALGRIDRRGLTTLARPLARSARAEERLMAVRLLTHHPGWGEVGWMTALARDDEAAVSAAALRSLNRTPELAGVVRGMTDGLTSEGRPNVRYQLAVAWSRAEPADAAPTLAAMLDDPGVAVRTFARDRLIELAADPAGRSPVAAAVGRVLDAPPGWRAAEQAALVAGRIDLDAAAPALLALLDHARPESRLAAADALRRLAVPDTLPTMLAHAEALTARWPDPDNPAAAADPQATSWSAQSLGHELVQLFEAFGQMGYSEADPLLRKYVPKSSRYGAEARGAAVYALGKILEGKSDARLANQLAGRLSDVSGLAPEAEPVRYFAAITLGRLGARGQLPKLQRFAESEAESETGGACRWAIGQITGQAPPAPEPETRYSRGYFLEPAEAPTP